ncbi:hypothetical protein PUN28_010701 [Cardiocondyla obscurior]|uniref:Uncharacterized protein n=1 Tax=Cardiocondyla obscurior TaxID=286306 RepID=A0AAW2FHC5_9HYME
MLLDICIKQFHTFLKENNRGSISATLYEENSRDRCFACDSSLMHVSVTQQFTVTDSERPVGTTGSKSAGKRYLRRVARAIRDAFKRFALCKGPRLFHIQPWRV